MAIKKSAFGKQFVEPGVYARKRVDQSAGAPLGSNGTMFILGEADQGAPGDVSGIRRFTSAEIPDLIAEYGSGRIVDMVLAARTPGFASQNVNGPDEYLVWKTNSSLQAELTLETSAPADLLTVKDRNWGVEGNKITVQVANGTDVSKQRVITIRKSGESEVLAENEAAEQLEIQYVGAGTAATLSISGSLSAKQLTTTVTGASGQNLNFDLENYTIEELVSAINNFDGGGVYTCSTSLSAASVTAANDLDPVTASDIKTSAVTLYRLQQELVDLINDNSELVSAALESTLVVGLPAVLAETPLAGGAKGASAPSDFTAGLDKSLAWELNVIVPAISRDASEDITDGLTDAASTYDIESLMGALRTHMNLRAQADQRRDAQAFVGYRKSARATVFSQAQTLGSEFIQLVMEDVLVTNQNSQDEWMHPHVLAAVMAGIRLGTEVGEPLTHKYLNILGKGHVVNPNTGLSTGDFDRALHGKSAILAGVTILEQVGGGFRCVLDNTTYGADSSFVWNRGSVVEAAQFIAKDIQDNVEAQFIGKKISGDAAESIKNFIRNRLRLLLADNILSPSPGNGAPKGYKEETFTVVITGNSALVQLEVIPVQGLDFVFIDFTLGDILQSA